MKLLLSLLDSLIPPPPIPPPPPFDITELEEGIYFATYSILGHPGKPLLVYSLDIWNLSFLFKASLKRNVLFNG